MLTPSGFNEQLELNPSEHLKKQQHFKHVSNNSYFLQEKAKKFRAGLAAKQTCHLESTYPMPSYSTPIQLPNNAPETQRMMVQVFQSLPPRWSLTPGFSPVPAQAAFLKLNQLKEDTSLSAFQIHM